MRKILYLPSHLSISRFFPKYHLVNKQSSLRNFHTKKETPRTNARGETNWTRTVLVTGVSLGGSRRKAVEDLLSFRAAKHVEGRVSRLEVEHKLRRSAVPVFSFDQIAQCVEAISAKQTDPQVHFRE